MLDGLVFRAKIAHFLSGFFNVIIDDISKMCFKD
jgi:hypothetical protein